MRQALIFHDGEMGRLLECVMALEAGSFEYAEAILPGAGQLYIDAMSWTNEAERQLADGPALTTA